VIPDAAFDAKFPSKAGMHIYIYIGPSTTCNCLGRVVQYAFDDQVVALPPDVYEYQFLMLASSRQWGPLAAYWWQSTAVWWQLPGYKLVPPPAAVPSLLILLLLLRCFLT
jgi:hypothetical protein